MIAAVRELGLGGRQNVSFARGLKALVGFGACGTRSSTSARTRSSSTSASGTADGEWRTVVDRAEVTRLGEGLDETGGSSAEPMERTVDAIAAWSTRRGGRGVEAIAAVGTAGLRIAPNSAEFVDARARRVAASRSRSSRARRRRGSPTSRRRPGSARTGGSLVVFDTGGGSSQFTFGHGRPRRRAVQRRTSARCASPSATASTASSRTRRSPRRSRRSPPTSRASTAGPRPDAARRHGRRRHEPRRREARARDVRPRRRAGHASSTAAEIDRQIELYRTRTADERREIVGLQPKRAEVILAGACIVRTVLAKLGRESLHGERPRPAARPARRAVRGPPTRGCRRR